jgi:hypothetical protein
MNQSYFKFLITFQLVIIITGCQPKEKENKESGNPDSMVDSEADLDLIKQVNVLPTESNPLARYVEIELATAGSVSLEFWHPDGPHFEKRFAPIDTNHLLPLIGLSADSTVHLVVHATSDNQEEATEILSFETEALPFPAPEFEVLVPMEPDGVITIIGVPSDGSPQITASYFGIDRTGEVVWIGRNGFLTRSAMLMEPYLDQTFIDLNSKRSNGFINYSILNPTSDVISTIETSLAGHHDLTVLPNGNIVILTHQEQIVMLQDGETKELRGDLVVEIQADGQVIWKWNSFDYLDPSTFQIPKNDSNDWTHGNNLQYLPETDELLVGFRNLNLLVTIDRSTSEITRRFGEDGDYALTNGRWFYGQHNSILQEDGTLTIYDNHYIKDQTNTSRVVQYSVDETAKTMEETWSIDLEHFYRSGGEAALLEKEGLLISAGGSAEKHGVPIQIFQTDANRNEVWRIHMDSESVPFVYSTSRLVSGTRMAPEDQTPSDD